MENALKGLVNVDDVEVTYGATGKGYAWTVSFLSENEQAPLLEASWKGRGCSACTNFSSSWSSAPEKQVYIEQSEDVGGYEQSAAMQAEDASRSRP